MADSFEVFMGRVRQSAPGFIKHACATLSEDDRDESLRTAGVDGLNAVCYALAGPDEGTAMEVYGRKSRGGGVCGPFAFGGSTPESAHVFFDPSRHGIDAELGFGEPNGSATRLTRIACPGCGNSKVKPVLVFQYSEPPDDPSDDELQRPEDFFSWVFVVGRCEACSTSFEVGDHECA